jgi:hypothetical protein
VSAAEIYLVYAEDGATLVYAGEDAAVAEAHCRALAAHYAGSLIGRRNVGPVETWVVRCFFRAEPSATFIAQRRANFRFSLTWEPACPEAEAADGG